MQKLFNLDSDDVFISRQFYFWYAKINNNFSKHEKVYVNICILIEYSTYFLDAAFLQVGEKVSDRLKSFELRELSERFQEIKNINLGSSLILPDESILLERGDDFTELECRLFIWSDLYNRVYISSKIGDYEQSLLTYNSINEFLNDLILLRRSIVRCLFKCIRSEINYQLSTNQKVDLDYYLKPLNAHRNLLTNSQDRDIEKRFKISIESRFWDQVFTV
ncbi:hypothetical protein [Zooshikella ganghwensis]|uniref:Uncharacterized protein n=1 Tax=Zooshikella ganghwensis TaxID=202772 RepID=A0A4P9VHY8_9GAMM|nr:hypothetical protein [Zooshikella ganghwensis]RDH41232.1 hypothetical protein B9G39_29410 [Zooshikella ganghwensis]